MVATYAAASAYSFQFVAAPADLQPFLNSLYIWSTDAAELVDCLPAYSGQLVAFVQGSGRMEFGDGVMQHTGDGFFMAPMMEAFPFHISGPARMLGVSLNFRGWAALTGLAVNSHNNRMIELGEAFAPSLAERVRDLAPAWRAGELDDTAVLDALAQIVRDGLRPLPEATALVIDRTLEWLSSSFKPDLAQLYAMLPYSERQVQRLVARYFGQSPIRLIRRYRAVRAATLLSMPDLPASLETEIRNAFYDQAHMIKELRFFTGRTPRRLLPDAGSVVNAMLGPEGYGSVDLFGGNQDEQLGRSPG